MTPTFTDQCLMCRGKILRTSVGSIAGARHESHVHARAQSQNPVSSGKLVEAQAAKWRGLQQCPRTCASSEVMLVTYSAWFQRPQHCVTDLLKLRISPRRLRALLRFRTGCHGLPVDVLRRGRNRVQRHLRVCSVCGSGQVCDEQHLVFECGALQHLRLQRAHLFVPVPPCSSSCGRPIWLVLLGSFLRLWIF